MCDMQTGRSKRVNARPLLSLSHSSSLSETHPVHITTPMYPRTHIATLRLGSGHQFLLLSVERIFSERSSAHLERRWGLLSAPSPSCLASCSPPQPAAPAPGLSARVGLVPPVTRFSAAGRPASTCSTARCDAKRQATHWRSNLWVRPLARQDRPRRGHLEC